MKVFITGGTGFVGTAVVEALIQKGYSATILTRRASPHKKTHAAAGIVEGDPMKPGKWQSHLLENDAVINLAGASIFQRWNDKNKRNIRDSRICATRNIVRAISNDKEKRIDLINASAVGYYGYHGDEIIEEGVSHGTDFLASVSHEWETEALTANASGSRVLLCRFGVVLGKEGGALGKLLPMFRLGIGSRLGSGNQWFSWIHIKDVIRIILFLLENRDIEGPVNCTAPNPVQNKKMTKHLGRVLKRPVFMPPVPGFALRIALGEFAETLLKGQRVIPKVLNNRGFAFLYSDFEDALQDIISS